MLTSKTGDFSRGADTTLHSIRMLARSAIAVTVAALLLAVIVTGSFAWHYTDDTDRAVAWRTGYAYLLSEVLQQKQAVLFWDTGDTRHKISVSDWFRFVCRT